MLSFIIPCFNEQEVLRETFGRLLDVRDSIKDVPDLVSGDDGSADDPRENPRNLEKTDPWIKVAVSSSNLGCKIAIIAGTWVSAPANGIEYARLQLPRFATGAAV